MRNCSSCRLPATDKRAEAADLRRLVDYLLVMAVGVVAMLFARRAAVRRAAAADD